MTQKLLATGLFRLERCRVLSAAVDSLISATGCFQDPQNPPNSFAIGNVHLAPETQQNEPGSLPCPCPVIWGTKPRINSLRSPRRAESLCTKKHQHPPTSTNIIQRPPPPPATTSNKYLQLLLQLLRTQHLIRGPRLLRGMDDLEMGAQ